MPTKETPMPTETQTMTQDQARRIVGRVLSMPRASDRIRPLLDEWRDLSARGAVVNAGQVARTIDDLAGHRDGASWVGYALIAEAFRFNVGDLVIVDCQRNPMFNGHKGRIVARVVMVAHGHAPGYRVEMKDDRHVVEATLALLETEVRAA